jgi:hypothetical protein
MTTKSRAAGAVLTLMVAWVAPLVAQEPGASRALNEAVSAQPAAGNEGGPLVVVTQVLSVAAEQVVALAQLLRERQETLAPILQEIAKREQRIRELIVSGRESGRDWEAGHRDPPAPPARRGRARSLLVQGYLGLGNVPGR